MDGCVVVCVVFFIILLFFFILSLLHDLVHFQCYLYVTNFHIRPINPFFVPSLMLFL